MNRQEENRFERLRSAVEAAGGNEVVAQKAGIGTTTLSGYMNGKEWKFTYAGKIAQACGVNLKWLLFGDSGRPEPRLSNLYRTTEVSTADTDGILVNCYDEAEASAGFGRWGTDIPEPKKFAISKAFLSDLGLTPNRTIIIRVAGDSMEPTLKSGDRIILNTSPVHILSGVTVFVSGGQLMVKRLSPTASGMVRIISDNERYPPEEVEISRFRWGDPDGGDAITIIGRVAYRLQALS